MQKKKYTAIFDETNPESNADSDIKDAGIVSIQTKIGQEGDVPYEHVCFAATIKPKLYLTDTSCVKGLK